MTKGSAFMRKNACLLMVSLLVLASCSDDEVLTFERVGADKDEHGCIGSAGYAWCAKTEQCERPWELAEKVSVENTKEAFEAYCNEG
jgi:hypothetical protein